VVLVGWNTAEHRGPALTKVSGAVSMAAAWMQTVLNDLVSSCQKQLSEMAGRAGRDNVIRGSDAIRRPPKWMNTVGA
jgi:hypothetical protein